MLKFLTFDSNSTSRFDESDVLKTVVFIGQNVLATEYKKALEIDALSISGYCLWITIGRMECEVRAIDKTISFPQ